MSATDLETNFLSDLEYDHLVAEVSTNDQFLYLLDREDGPENVCIAFPRSSGELGKRIPLADFIAHLQAAADNLKR